MTVSVRLTCPFCDNRERMEVIGPLKMWATPNYGRWEVSTDAYASSLTAAAATVCPECRAPFGLYIRPGGTVATKAFFDLKSNDSVDAALQGGGIRTFPEGSAPKADESLPEKIREPFVCIQEDAASRRNPAGILSGARGCLDVALKALGETEGGRRTRIQNLAAKGILTHGIAEWAQNLWEDGSDAVHDLDADIERAIEHVDFLRLFFVVAFTLPSRIQRASHGTVELDNDESGSSI